jgi:hypothetical protein
MEGVSFSGNGIWEPTISISILSASFGGLGFELRALHMQSRHSTTSALVIFDRGLWNYLPYLTLNLDPPNLSLPGS